MLICPFLPVCGFPRFVSESLLCSPNASERVARWRSLGWMDGWVNGQMDRWVGDKIPLDVEREGDSRI